MWIISAATITVEFLQQSFINKYYKNVSPNLPFIYHTSRCDPELKYHTTTKTQEELLLHVITALVHNGAFLLVDAINPDGSIVPEVYHDIMKGIYFYCVCRRMTICILCRTGNHRDFRSYNIQEFLTGRIF